MKKQYAEQQSLLEIELDRLKNAVAHLVRSNEALKEAYQQEEKDPEYKQALGENIVIIAKYRAQIAALEEEIRKLKGVKMLEPLAVTTTDAQAAPPTASGRDQQKHGAAAGTAGGTAAGMPAPAGPGTKDASADMTGAEASAAQATPEPMQEDDAGDAPAAGVWL